MVQLELGLLLSETFVTSPVHPLRKTVISDDSIGLFGTPRDLAQANGDLDCAAINIESFPPNYMEEARAKISSYEQQGYNVACLHGRTGGDGYSRLDSLKLAVANDWILDTPRLIREFGKSYDLLFHDKELENQENFKLIVEYKPKIIWVENHTHGIDGVRTALAMVRRLRESEVRAGMMLDLVHCIGSKNLTAGDFPKHWNSALEIVQYVSTLADGKEDAYLEGIHFPIGTDAADSLPVDTRMTDSMLGDFARLLNRIPSIRRLVVEYQEKGLADKLVIWPWTLHRQRARKNRLYARLAKLGILPDFQADRVS